MRRGLVGVVSPSPPGGDIRGLRRAFAPAAPPSLPPSPTSRSVPLDTCSQRWASAWGQGGLTAAAFCSGLSAAVLLMLRMGRAA